MLSRRISVRADQPVSLANLFPVLQDKYANCTLVAMNFGGASLVAATPERLFRVRSGKVAVDALAGTVAADDATPRLEMQQYEHLPVVTAIKQALAPLCGKLEFEKQPKRMLLGNLQHLWTPVKGRLKNKVSLFQLLDGLHPTPAVGGVPAARACSWISQQESWRGWYTGGFGWIGDNREGDLAVLLRCALIDGRDAELFAGAGITSISNPADELNETWMKFEAMLGALKGKPDGPGMVNIHWCMSLLNGLASAGVTQLVISPGSRSTPLVIAADLHPALNCHVLVDERSAAFFALGMARCHNVPVALICTSGSAPANWYPAVVEASQSFVPLVLLTADRPWELQSCGANQTIDQVKLFGDQVNSFHALPPAEASPASLSRLHALGRQVVTESLWPAAGPVHINMPFREPLVPAHCSLEFRMLKSACR